MAADLPDGRFLLEFEIEDTGIGIPSEIVPTLFHHFTQADSSITRTYGGTGLGLAISKRLCELLGGSISVSSTPGKGSVFRFSIAAGPGDAPALRVEQSTDRAAESVAPVLRPLRILVVDDNAVNQLVVGGLLTRAGHDVATANSGPAAIAAVTAAQARPFDVVLMDVQMPDMDGLTATRRIRALPQPHNAVPVIALTAHASNSSREECLAAGMNGFVSKPVRLQPLLDAVAEAIDDRAVQSGVAPDAPVADALLDAEQVAELTASLSPESWDRIVASFGTSAAEEIDHIMAAIEAGQSSREGRAYAQGPGVEHRGACTRQFGEATRDRSWRCGKVPRRRPATVTVPQCRRADCQDPVTGRGIAMATENYGRLKLLFVDDTAHTRLMLREMLRNTKWSHAEFAESAAAAFEAIQANLPDLVFTDWNMPGQNGLDLIHNIRERLDSPDPLLPVILLTAAGDAEHVMSARKAGALGFLVKPISMSRIIERVTNAVTQQRPFIVSPGYKGPDRRNAGQLAESERRGQDGLPPDAIVVPPDGLLLAKVRGDPEALREAMRRRSEAIAIVRRVVREQRRAAMPAVR